MVLAALGLVLPLAGLSNTDPRIISLDLCTDWMLTKFADSSQILALSPMSQKYPAPWLDKKLPVHNGSLEQIIKLKPGVIITGEYNAVQLRKRLTSLGKRVEVISLPQSLYEIQKYTDHFTNLLNLNRTNLPELKLNQGNSIIKPGLLLLGANAIATGRDTFENDIIEQAGWTNYIQRSGYITLDLEQLVLSPPDMILWSAPVSNALSNQFANHRLLKKLFKKNQFKALDFWQWQCPGPWTFDLIKSLHELLPKNE